MAEIDQKETLRAHLNELIQELERKLSNPKNTWKREQDLNQDLSEAQKRLRSIERLSNRSGRGQSRFSNTSRSDRTRSIPALRTDRGREQGQWERDEPSQSSRHEVIFR